MNTNILGTLSAAPKYLFICSPPQSLSRSSSSWLKLTNWFQKVETMWRWAARNRSTSLSWLWGLSVITKWCQLNAIIIVVVAITVIILLTIAINSVIVNIFSFKLYSHHPSRPASPCRGRRRSRRCWTATLSSRAFALSISDDQHGHIHGDNHENYDNSWWWWLWLPPN